MSDLISRQDAITYLSEHMSWYSEDGYEADEDEKGDVITDLVNGVPSARPTGEWIPVSERLPDKDGRYLVTYPIGGDDTPWVNVLHYGDVEGIRWFYESDHEWGDLIYDDAVAWMPLPEPYHTEVKTMTTDDAIKDLKAIKSVVEWEHPMDWQISLDMAIDALRESQFVRCKDCKHYMNEHICMHFSKYGTIQTDSYAYCAYGERRDDEQVD